MLSPANPTSGPLVAVGCILVPPPPPNPLAYCLAGLAALRSIPSGQSGAQPEVMIH